MDFFSPLNPTLWASLLASPLSVDGVFMQYAFSSDAQKQAIMKQPSKVGLTFAAQAIVGIPIGMLIDQYLGVSGNSIQSAIITFASIYLFQIVVRAVTKQSLNKMVDIIAYF